ncbi:MAG: hypothetical protein C4532_18570 [Candidatus Abyssobacteria bacterium SURF_17]|jgi:hypothetical protein|uniref:Uncharacterized protein n=1 Tax=Candidatus Abyssobacteria bacterium SURF_17 TaxID=2093361 RepID=A0A419EPM7_9BACT|nr:MAG: hypothetical protein C4532_18570 [Candidatus Abyssubacteria bacterium SURF_17]
MDKLLARHHEIASSWMLVVRFLIYVFVFHVPFTLILRPQQGGERSLYFMLLMCLLYFPFLFWELHSCRRKGKDYRVMRNRSIVFSCLIGIHWLVMMYLWDPPSGFVTLNGVIIVTVVYCSPWAIFGLTAAKVVWKFFGAAGTPRRRMTGLVAIPVGCVPCWLAIFFYTVWMSLLVGH